MKLPLILFIVSTSISLIILSLAIFYERKTLSLKFNTRVLIISIFSAIVATLDIIYGNIASNLFNINIYYFILVLFGLSILFWFYKLYKEKHITLFTRALNKEFNFEEIFIYLMIFSIIFPILTDIVKEKSKFPFEFEVKLNNDYLRFTKLNNRVNYDGLLTITNHINDKFMVEIESIGVYSQSYDIPDSLLKVNHSRIQKITATVGPNSINEITLFQETLFLPNFIGGLDMDSLHLISPTFCLEYFRTKFQEGRDKLSMKYSNNMNDSDVLILRESEENFFITYSWAARISLHNLYSHDSYEFNVKGDISNRTTVFFSKYGIMLAPGPLYESFFLEPNYSKNDKEIPIDKDILTVHLNEDIDNITPIYNKPIRCIINAGEQKTSILLNTKGFQSLFYFSKADIRDTSYYYNLPMNFNLNK